MRAARRAERPTALFPDYADPCKEIGGLWDGSKYMTDASPCASPSGGDIGTGGIIGIILAAVIAVILLLLVLVMCRKEKEGKPLFTPTAVTKAGA